MSLPESIPGTSSPRLESKTDERGIVCFLPQDAFELVYAGVHLSEVTFAEKDQALIEHDLWCAAFDKPEAGLRSSGSPADENARRQAKWHIPEPYASLDLRAILAELCRDEADQRRVAEELDLFESRNLTDLVRAAVYVTHTAKNNGLVVGVGRGSSVASHVLFLLGVHRIDSLKYGLDVREFVRT